MPLRLDFGIAKRVVVLGAPVIIAMLSQTAVNIVDTILVGMLEPHVATTGQAALAISLPVFWMFGGFCAALGVGTQAIVARRHGEKDPAAAGAVLANSLALVVAVSAVLTIAGWFLLPAIFRLMHDDPGVQEVGTTYTRLRFLGMLSMTATAAYKAFYDGTERTWVHLVASAVLNVANLGLAWLLVFGALGFPRLEVRGAGIAAVIASYLGLAVMIAFTLRSIDRVRYRPYRVSHVKWAGTWAIAKLSLPSGLATAVVMTGFLMVYWVVGRIDDLTPQLGAVHTAATKIVVDILSIAFIGSMGLGTATATLVSKSLGEKDPGLAERFGREGLKLGVWCFAILGAIEAAFPDFFTGLFTSNPVVVEMARWPLRMAGAVEWALAAGFVATQCLFGAGNTRYVMYAEGMLHFGVLVPGAYLLGLRLGWGLMGVWSAVVLYILGLATAMTVKFVAGGWKSIRI